MSNNISNSSISLHDYFLVDNYVKPQITVGNYFLKWNDSSYGILSEEIPELKNFLYKSIDLLPLMYENLQNFLVPKNINKTKKNNSIPKIHLYHRLKQKNQIRFHLSMLVEGTTVLEREEETIISRNEQENNSLNNIKRIRMVWIIGELLFDRRNKKIDRYNNKKTG